mmetsp:Transcript_53161/g.123763  ORF Transcript_53161/g.123763 Transcript_53161/m.123763 type:complete len:304 (+) Transcript_53161:52-963(+)
MGQQCTIPSLSGASKEIDVQVENIERKISKADQTIRHYVEKASDDPVAKQRALQAMKRKKMLEQQRQDLIGAQFNVDSLQDQQEQAKFTLRAVEAMRAGRDELRRDQCKMDVKQVEEMLDQTEDMADDMRAISESLARGSDQASLENELLQLQREYGAVGLPKSSAGVPPVGMRLEPERAVAAASSGSRQARAKQPWRNGAAAQEDSEARAAAADAPLPPPPPPPPASAQQLHQQQRQQQQQQQEQQPMQQQKTPAAGLNPVDQRKADLWAASALSAAMAPHGHLPYPGPTPTKPRVAVPALY